MWGYILGIVLGSIVLALLALVLVVYLTKSLTHHRNIKMISLKAKVRINRDIKTWSWQTHNLFLPRPLFKYQANQVLEIDSILITSQAIFIIEIKSIRGSVEGDGQMSYWHKKNSDKQFKIANPIFQNEKNLDYISKMLNANVPIVSLIIFSNRTDELKIENVPDHVVIFKHNRLFEKLDDLEKNLNVAFSKYEMRTLYGKLKSFKINKWTNFKLHKWAFLRTNK